MSLFDRLKKAIQAVVRLTGENVEVVDLRGAEKLPPRKSPPLPKPVPLEPRPMPPGWEDAIDIGDLVEAEPRDIGEFANEIPDRGDGLTDINWAYTWDLMPTGDMSDGQIQTAINMIERQLAYADWEEIWEDMREDYWDWYREQYTGSE